MVVNQQFLVKSSIFLAIIISGTLVFLKGFIVYSTNSIAVAASFIDSCLDLGFSALNAFAAHHALKPADKEHRFGHGKIEALMGILQASLTFFSVFYLMKEGYSHFLNSQSIQIDSLIFFIMIGSNFLVFFLILWQKKVIKETDSLIVKSDCLHYKGDFLINIVAITGCILGSKWGMVDLLCGLLIGLYICKSAFGILKKSFDVLLDRELSDEIRYKIYKTVMQHPKANGLHDLRTRNSGLNNFMQFHLEVDPTLTIRQAHNITEEIIEMLNKEFVNYEVFIHQDFEDDCSKNKTKKHI